MIGFIKRLIVGNALIGKMAGIAGIGGLTAFGMVKYQREIDFGYLMAIDKFFPQSSSDKENPSVSNFQSDPDAPHLVKHMETFADSRGFISYESMYNALKNKWHFNDEEAHQFAKNVLINALYQGVPGLSFSPSGVVGEFAARDASAKLMHPFDSGFYNKDTGNLDEERFSKLARYTIKNDADEDVITPSCIKKYLDDFHNEDERWKEASWFNQKIGARGNKGEFENSFKKLASGGVDNNAIQIREPYITLEDFKAFLLNSAPLIQEIADGLRPVSQIDPQIPAPSTVSTSTSSGTATTPFSFRSSKLSLYQPSPLQKEDLTTAPAAGMASPGV